MEPTKHEYYYEFPVIETISKSGKKLYWQMFAGLVKSDMRNDFTVGMMPNELDIPCQRILPIYENNSKMSPTLKGFLTTATWNEKTTDIKLKAATFITSGKNENKENRTNTWTQTIKEAKSACIKKNKPNEKKDLLLPMLATGEAILDSELDDALEKIFNKHKGEIRTQIKFDGHRLMVRLDDDIFPYSRSGDVSYISNVLLDQLKIVRPIVKNFFGQDKTIYLDGEYYLHGVQLQDISSAIRVETQCELKDRMIYYIFDVVTTQDGILSSDVCKTRLWNIKLLRDACAKYDLKNIVFAESNKPSSPDSLKADYLLKKDQNYEGLIARVLSRPYESGKSSGLIKIKGSFREEFIIVGFKAAKGKHSDMVIFRCRMTEKTIERAVEYAIKRNMDISQVDIRNPGRIEFWVTPAATEDERRDMFENAKSYEGKLYTVEFQDWSNQLKPTRPQGIALYHP